MGRLHPTQQWWCASTSTCIHSLCRWRQQLLKSLLSALFQWIPSIHIEHLQCKKNKRTLTPWAAAQTTCPRKVQVCSKSNSATLRQEFIPTKQNEITTAMQSLGEVCHLWEGFYHFDADWTTYSRQCFTACWHRQLISQSHGSNLMHWGMQMSIRMGEESGFEWLWFWVFHSGILTLAQPSKRCTENGAKKEKISSKQQLF